MRIWFGLVVLFAAQLAPSCFCRELENPPSPAASQVNVLLRDGRRFIAHVDQHTDDETLWLRVERNSVAMSTGFTWDLVQSVRVNDASFTAAEFRDVSEYFISKLPVSHNKPGSLTIVPTLGFGIIDPRVATEKVQMLSVDANVANWDRDAELDGIELRILPRAANGRVLPLNGAVMVDLIGREQMPGTTPHGFPTLGSWTQPIRAAQFAGQSGAVVRLPFRNAYPTLDLGLLSFGMVAVRLNATGHGESEANAPVRLRTFNPIRDQLYEHQLRHDSFGRYRARHW
jgi:hypothetical protein